MNETRHTQGPWEAKRINNSTGDTLYHCHIFVEPSICGVWSPPGNAEAEANTHLIAAAPDLLAALEDILAATNLRGSDHTLEAKAKAAITKAKGLTS